MDTDSNLIFETYQDLIKNDPVRKTIHAARTAIDFQGVNVSFVEEDHQFVVDRFYSFFDEFMCFDELDDFFQILFDKQISGVEYVGAANSSSEVLTRMNKAMEKWAMPDAGYFPEGFVEVATEPITSAFKAALNEQPSIGPGAIKSVTAHMIQYRLEYDSSCICIIL